MTEDEINQIKEETEDDNELLIIDNVLDLKNLKAIDIMCPRADIIGIEKSDDFKTILNLVKGNSHSAYPVYNTSLDDIIGVVKSKDILLSMLNSKNIKISTIMQKCLFISPTMPVLDILLKMRSDGIDMALVIDEFGGIDGLISVKDIVEEIVGEIKGVNKDANYSEIKRHKNGTLTVDARMLLEDFEKEVGASLTDDENIDTVGGVIFDEIGRIPVKGELITLNNGVAIEILEANPRSIRTIKIQKL